LGVTGNFAGGKASELEQQKNAPEPDDTDYRDGIANDSTNNKPRPKAKTISSTSIRDIKSFPKEGHTWFDVLQDGLWSETEEEQTGEKQ
jgi:hypothetical protein